MSGTDISIELVERMERADGPDRELDWAIYGALSPALDMQEIRGRVRTCNPKWLPKYTASIDDALTLVAEGMEFTVSSCRPGILGFQRGPFAAVGLFEDAEAAGRGYAATPALALCAAALRSRMAPKT